MLSFPGSSVVKNLPAMQEMQEEWVLSLNLEDPLEEEMANHFNILAWRIPWTEKPGGLQSIGSQRDITEWAQRACMCARMHTHTHTHTSLMFILLTSYLEIEIKWKWVVFFFFLSDLAGDRVAPKFSCCGSYVESSV